MENEKHFNKEYWEKNIEGFSGFYDKQSEENIPAPAGISFFYRKVIFPMEKKYMYQRHAAVSDFIQRNVKEGMKTADIGCGSGVYTKKMVQLKTEVFAFDYVESALELTRKNLTPEERSKCHIALLDISKEHIPNVDIAISIGVLPYIEDLKSYLGNILPYTNHVLFNYLDKNHALNALRRSVLKFLDVRKYSYHPSSKVLEELTRQNFELVKKSKLATGYMIEAKRK